MQHGLNQPGMLQMANQQRGHHEITESSVLDDDNEPEPYFIPSNSLFFASVTPNQNEESDTLAKADEEKDSSIEISKGATMAPAKPTLDNNAPDIRKAPDRTSTSTSLMSIEPSRASDVEACGGEIITIEEYRKQLQQYIEKNQTKSTGGNNDDDDDINYPSDLEDDWEKEREKNLRDDRTRGVGRNVSGISYMSSKTAKSGHSMVSGISSGIFSADMSDDDATPLKVNNNSLNNSSSRSLCSNLSIMSELTDLSENIDTLTLDD